MENFNYNRSFINANEAFMYFFDYIKLNGELRNNTLSIQNQGFYIKNPIDRNINCEWRKWNINYAEKEWLWYLSKNRDVTLLKQSAKLWDKMHNGNNIVNSNYGYLWNRNDQLSTCIDKLLKDKNTRQAYITLFDGKDRKDYDYDTPCTLNIGFVIINNKLNMNVVMRSNDLVYGFCNDQYCFSKLQEFVAKSVGIDVGTYYHFVHDLHIYEKHFDLKEKYFKKIY